MSWPRKDSPYANIASTSQEVLEQDGASSSSSRILRVTLLADEWGSSKGGLSTINRELAKQLAKHPDVKVTFFVPKCSDEDRKAAGKLDITVVEAKERHGFEPVDWLTFPPNDLAIDVVVGHGVKLGRQAQIIRDSHHCKWVQVAHIAPEELAMFRSHPGALSRGEEKQQTEIKLCEIADFVVAIGPKIADDFSAYLRACKKEVFDLTPSICSEFADVEQAPKDLDKFRILVFGRSEAEDFELKGYDIAAQAVAELKDQNYHLIFVGAPSGEEDEVQKKLLKNGIVPSQLTVRSFRDNRERLAKLFCEADLAIMPSRSEAFGLTALEALSAGLPVLVCGNSGFAQALRDVPFGSSCIVDSEDAKVWAEKIKHVHQKGRKSRLEESQVLRTNYAVKFDWQKQCEAFVEKLLSMVQEEVVSKERGKRLLSNPGIQASKTPKLRTGTYKEEVVSKERGKRLLSNPGIQASKTPKLRTRTYKEEVVSKERGKRLLSNPGIQASKTPKLGTGTYKDVFDPTKLIERIRQLYKTREGRLSPFHWCEDFHFQLNDIYTRLKVVGKEKTRHTVTEQITNVTGIFRAHEECEKPRTVLIEAQPGMGKSVYCQKLAYDWATEQVTDASFKQIEVLLLLRCHEITTNIWEAIDDQILPRDAREEEKQSFFNFIRANQSKVLLVLDGLDEVPSSKLPMFSDLIEGRELPECHIVVTARQGAGMKVRKYSDTLLEIVGFTEEDARLFIGKYFKNMEDLAEKLSDKLRTEESLKDMAANPLNTALLCLLCEDFKGVFPRSRTYLYIEIVRCILRRFRKRQGLPTSDEDLIEVYKEQLKRLGLVALNGLRNDKFVFDEDELGGQTSDIPDFGFLSVQSGSSKRRPRRCYGFPHKSFQEFFAGFYLCCGVCDGEIEVESLVTDRRYLEELKQVLLFTSGVTASRSEEKAVCIIKSIAEQVNLLAAVRDQKEKDEEEKDEEEEDEVLVLRSRVVVALECIEECRTEESKLSKHLACTLGSELELNSLDLAGVVKNNLVESLSEALKVNTSLTVLHLSGNKIGGCAGAVESLSEALKVNTSLTDLDLSWNEIGVCAGAVESLSEALKVNTSLTGLNLSGNNIGDRAGAVESLSEALKVNTSLTDLNLSENNIGVCAGAVESLSEALIVNTTLHLDLSDDNIDDGIAELLFKGRKDLLSKREVLLAGDSSRVKEEGDFWEFTEAAAFIRFPPKAVTEPMKITCSLLSPRTCSPPLDENEALVSNVIKLFRDGLPGLQLSTDFNEGVTLALSHSATDLKGYEVVIKQLVDPENNQWKDLETKNTWSEAGIQGDPGISGLLLPLAEAKVTQCSSFAVVWRLKSFTFSSSTTSLTDPVFTCIVPEYPDVSVTIATTDLPESGDFSVTIKVQEVPICDEVKDVGVLVGPILHISSSPDVQFLEPVVIRIPFFLRESKREVLDFSSGHLRILFFNCGAKNPEWSEITEKLETPADVKDGVVTVQVKHFSIFSTLLSERKSEPSSSELQHLVKKPKMPQEAGFLACLRETSPSGIVMLTLSCYPLQMKSHVNSIVSSRCKVLGKVQRNGIEEMHRGDKAFVSVMKLIKPLEDVDLKNFFLRFLGDDLFERDMTVSVGGEGVPKVELVIRQEDQQEGKLMCELFFSEFQMPPSAPRADNCFSASASLEVLEQCNPSSPSNKKLKVTLLADEWGSSEETCNGDEVQPDAATEPPQVKEGPPSNDDLEEVAGEIGGDWKTLGRRLKVKEAKLTAFHKENEELTEKAFQMLLHWKRKKTRASYQDLYDALCHSLVGRTDLALKFCCDERL